MSVRGNTVSAPDTKAGRLQRACLDLLGEHERDGALPTSIRFLYYELVQRGIVGKQRTGARRTDQDTNRRYKDGRPHEAVETEALRQTVLVDILHARLDDLLPTPLARVHERAERQRRAIRRLLTDE